MKRNKGRSESEKLAVLEEAKQIGVAAACRKHGVVTSMFYRWKERLEASGSLKRDPADDGREALRKLRELESENLRLKLILADKELELRIQRDLLKKKMPGQH
jgi:putative transposase